MTQADEPEIDRYIEELLAEPGRVLQAMEKEGARAKLPLIDRQVGALLRFLCRSVGAARVLEIGTCIGYSTAWLAGAVGPNGRVISLEIDAARARRARANLKRARLLDRVEVREGDAAKLLRTMEPPFDLIFNDGAKQQYPAVARAALKLLRPGGLLVSDNALWGGSVARRGGDADTRAIRAHNRFVCSHDAFEATLIPVRDGVLVARRT